MNYFDILPLPPPFHFGAWGLSVGIQLGSGCVWALEFSVDAFLGSRLSDGSYDLDDGFTFPKSVSE